MKRENATLYLIIYSAATIEGSDFAMTKSRGLYPSLAAARSELEKQIEAERKVTPVELDCEDQGEDFWVRYQDGFAAAAYTRLEIIPATLDLGRTA